jgi:hypothetical protein
MPKAWRKQENPGFQFMLDSGLIAPCETCIDIGPSVKPGLICKPDLCIEAHGPVCDLLRMYGYNVIHGLVNDVLPTVDPVDTIFALDVIEHMTKDDGWRFLDLCAQKAKQTVIFTPLGDDPQGEIDGNPYQAHLSAWYPADFHLWRVVTMMNFHGPGRHAFWAVSR